MHLVLEVDSDKALESMVERIFLTRKPQMAQAIIGVGKNKMFGRLNFRHLKIGETYSVLLIIEDLTLEKRQLLLNQKHRQAGIRKASESDSPIKHRNTRDDIKTEVCVYLRDESGGNPFTGQVVSGVKATRA